MHVTVLGSVKCRTNGTQWTMLAPSTRQLLAIMVAAGPAGLSFERAADELWPNDLPATWDPSLRMAFTRVRRHLPTDSLISKNGWCQLDIDVNDVDVWSLAELADAPTLSGNAETIVSLIAQDVFPGVEICPIVRSAIDEFDLLRSQLLDRLIAENAAVSTLAAARLRSFAQSRDWDTELTRQSEQLSEAAARAETSTGADVAPSATVPPPSLDRHRATLLIGRDDTVDQLVRAVIHDENPTTTLAARAHSGRTAVLAEAGAQLAQLGWRVIHLEAARPPADFGPFLQALPGLREPLVAALGSDQSAAQVRSLAWASILQALDDPVVPTCVIVDDVELLDRNSEDALEFIVRSTTTQRLAVLATFDAELAVLVESSWLEAPRIALDPVEPRHIQEMVASVHPDSTDVQRLQLSKDVAELADGLAGRAMQLIQAADPQTLTLPSLIAEHTNPDHPTIDLDANAQRVAAAISVAGDIVSLSQIEHITRDPMEDIMAAVNALLGLGALGETSKPDEFVLGPSHRRTDFVSTLPPHELARFHRRAMSLPDRGPVALAAHALQARPLLSDEEVCGAQLNAAQTLAASRSHREAVAHFRAAEDLGATMDVPQLTAYAAALQFAGTDAPELRQRAVTLALEAGQPGLALEAALVGLPATEQLNGDPERTALIESIQPEALTVPDQGRRHLWLSRQLLLESRIGEAEQAATLAAELATTIDERADAWLALAHIDGWMPTRDNNGTFHPLTFPSPSDVSDPARRTRLWQATAISALIAGDFAAAADAVDQAQLEAGESGDPLRVWNAVTLRVTLLNNDLQFSEADRVADQNRDLGVSYALLGAVSVRLAQRANQSMLLGRAGDQLERVEKASQGGQDSLLTLARFSLQLAAAGRIDEAMQVAESALHGLADSRFGLSAAGVLSVAVRNNAPDLAAKLWDILEPHRGQQLIIGSGLTSHGPVEGLLANVAADVAESFELRRKAIEIADGWNSPLWQILTRLTLRADCERLERTAEAAALRAEAIERAGGTDFAERERWGLFSH